MRVGWQQRKDSSNIQGMRPMRRQGKGSKEDNWSLTFRWRHPYLGTKLQACSRHCSFRGMDDRHELVSYYALVTTSA